MLNLKEIKLINVIIAAGALLASCTSVNKAESPPVYNSTASETAKLHYSISLFKLEQNTQFAKIEDTYRSTAGGHKITVKLNPFETRTAAQSFLLSRRTYLHQAYSTVIAPYFGVMKADPECMKLVDVSGVIKKQDGSESVSMSFVADAEETLLDCYTEKPAFTVKYLLKFCHKNQTVYEVKLINKIGQPDPAINLNCN